MRWLRYNWPLLIFWTTFGAPILPAFAIIWVMALVMSAVLGEFEVPKNYWRWVIFLEFTETI